MRYEITHVLEGIALRRGAQLDTLAKELQAGRQQLADKVAHRAGGPRALEEVLRVQATYLVTLRQLTRDDFQRVTGEVTRLERSLPTMYDVGQLERKLEQLQTDHDQLAVQADSKDTRLEQFLRALLAGGETMVSQHSLKQSGFAVDKLTDCIVARMNAQVADNG